MPVDAAALIPPAVIARINPDGENIFTAEVRCFGDVETGTRIPAVLAANVPAIEPVAAVAEDAIELDPKNSVNYFSRGVAEKAKGDLAAANADFKRAIELNPKLKELSK